MDTNKRKLKSTTYIMIWQMIVRIGPGQLGELDEIDKNLNMIMRKDAVAYNSE